MSDSITQAPFAADELAAIREELPAASSHHYLNAGFMGPIPRRAQVAMLARQEIELQNRLPSTWLEDAHAFQAAARVVVAQLTGVSASHVALMHATHDALGHE